MPNYRRIARRKAKKYGISNPNFFVRQIGAESNFDPNARSPAGAIGIGQFMPATARGLGFTAGVNPVKDLDEAAKLMAGYEREYGGYGNALRAYNAGPAAIEASKGYAETNAYVAKILNGADPGPPSTSKPQPQGQGGSDTGLARTPQRQSSSLVKETGFDQAGYDKAKKLTILGQLLEQRDPQSNLLKLGVVPMTVPSRDDFLTSNLTVKSTSSPGQNRPNGGGGGGKTLYVGDSLGEGTSPYLPNADANTKVGRTSAEGRRILVQKLSQGGSYGRIVLDLGTNDPNGQELAKTIRTAKRLAPGAQIFVPLVNGPAADRKNAVIKRLAGGNVHAVQWSAPLAADGIHSTPQGYRQRAQELKAAMGTGGGDGGQRGGGGNLGKVKVLESFYNGPGGENTDEGRAEPRGFVSGHTDHVHVAAATHAQAVALGRLAQSYGLTVRELEPFDKVDPVHTEGSFHYRGLAADVSGPADAMAKYSRRVARMALR